MKSSRVSQSPRDNALVDATPLPPGDAAGKLGIAEAFLYTGARGIERTIDAVRDRPVLVLAIALALLAALTLVTRA